MNLIELLKVAMDQSLVKFQYVHDCLVNIKEKKRPEVHSEISLVTKEISPNDVMRGEDKIGVIL